jgi:phospholipid/cholesterol/gamma-HCH transport system substrate-binding protein
VSRYVSVMDESVAGLNLNAPVKFSGVDVGQVEAIRLDPANPTRVELRFAIERGTPIKTDTLAVLRTQGLTGIAYVELSGGAPEAALLPTTDEAPYPIIRSKPSLSARLENVLTSVLAKLDRTSSNIDATLSAENRANFSAALADIGAVARTLAERRDSIDKTLASAARTFENGERATAQLAAQAGPLLDRMGRSADAVEKMGRDTSLAARQAGDTVVRVGGDLQRVTSDTLPELERLLGELNTLSASLRRLSEQTERNPSSLVFGRGAATPGPGETASTERRP